MINQKIIDNAPDGAEYYYPVKNRYYRRAGKYLEFFNSYGNWEVSIVVDEARLIPLHHENWTEEEENRMPAIEQNGNCGTHYESGNKYQRDLTRSPGRVSEINGKRTVTIRVDIYDLIDLYEVKNPATAHAIKKLFMSGARGYKDTIQDLKESIDAIHRAIQLEENKQ